MLSKNKSKYIRSLRLKKYRDTHRVYVAEGIKPIESIIEAGCIPSSTYIKNDAREDILSFLEEKKIEYVSLREDEYKKISFFDTSGDIISTFPIPVQPQLQLKSNELYLYLDDIQDPGNLGTILRLAHWFDIGGVCCSPHTADIYNPKAVSASTGSVAHTKVEYCTYEDIKQRATSASLPIIATSMGGKDINEVRANSQKKGCLLIMGNEGKGVAQEILDDVSERVAIPRYASGGIESLNVSTATAIFLWAFKSQA